MAKVYDCFMYGGEKDVLEIRLNTLGHIVDKFIIVEGNRTHRGTPKKPLFDPDINARIKVHEHKIVHIVANLDNYSKPWDRENAQRNAIMEGLTDADPNDVILISDADEIPDPNALRYVLDTNTIKPVKLVFRMPFLYYNFKWIKKFECHGTTAILKKNLDKLSPQDLRNSRFTDSYIRDAGWHCSFFGSPEEIANKIQEYAHDEWKDPIFHNIDYIKERIEKGLDIYNRGTSEDMIPRESKNIPIPEYVLKNKDRFIRYV